MGHFPRAPKVPRQMDHEYNRMGPGNTPKRSKTLKRRIVPDIIYHQRRITADEDPSANSLVIEVKLIPEFDGTIASIRTKRERRALEKDLQKLHALRSKEDDFRYQHTVSVVFSERMVWVAVDGLEFEQLIRLNSHRLLTRRIAGAAQE